MDRYVILRKLDEPERIGLWTFDEFGAMAIPFFVGILTGHVVIGILFGFLGWWALRKAKAGRATSWLLHMGYWHLPPGVTGIRAIPPSYLRLMAG